MLTLRHLRTIRFFASPPHHKFANEFLGGFQALLTDLLRCARKDLAGSLLNSLVHRIFGVDWGLAPGIHLVYFQIDALLELQISVLD